MIFKSAIAAEADPTKLTELRHAESAEGYSRDEGLAERSRLLMLEEHRVNAHLSRLIRMRKRAIAALPAELQEEAGKPDFSDFPVHRRVFTDTPPIKDFQK